MSLRVFSLIVNEGKTYREVFSLCYWFLIHVTSSVLPDWNEEKMYREVLVIGIGSRYNFLSKITRTDIQT